MFIDKTNLVPLPAVEFRLGWSAAMRLARQCNRERKKLTLFEGSHLPSSAAYFLFKILQSLAFITREPCSTTSINFDLSNPTSEAFGGTPKFGNYRHNSLPLASGDGLKL
jgi:hypothetical protein